MKCIDELFDAQVARTPEAIAVVFKDSSITYGELNRRAETLADRLRAHGVGPDVLVALFLERSLEMVVGLLAVLKAGGAYVPLDPVHPTKRLVKMLADAQPLVLLTQERLLAELPPHESYVVVIDAPAQDPAEHPNKASIPGQSRSPRDLAYVIYTSGSTGEPKGVEIEHCSVVNMLTSMQRRPGFGADDIMLAITTLVFDIAALEIFLPLANGARLVVAATETVRDGAALGDLITKSGASVMQTTPATLRMLLDSGWTGAPHLKILCGGEAWTTELASQLLPRCGALWNMYGPTETTVWSAAYKVEAGSQIVIGPPIANTRLYVLDGAFQLVPVGVAGELHIGGRGVARGYRLRPQLTSERFVTDPFAAEPGSRMYRTGDLARRLPDGTVEFLGRLDHQVKIRGFRIELGEIEARLMNYPGLREVVVLAREDQPGEKRLVAYFIGGVDISTAALRAHLANSLPEYMIPAGYVRLEALPLTPNGKVDRKALPPPELSAQEADVAALDPRTPIEKSLARIWYDMLGLKQVGRRDDFFYLGGHSLLAVRVVGVINKTLNTRLTLPEFFQDPTIEGIAKALERKRGVGTAAKLVQLQSGHTGLPIYFIGAGPHEHRIVQSIGEGRPIFAIDAPIPLDWHDTIASADPVAPPTIEQLSALYSDALCAHAGSAPCVVAGYSLAGKIAFEAARALQRAGGNVVLVLLLDATGVAWKRPASKLEAGIQSMLWIWQNAKTRASIDTPYTVRLSAFAGHSWRLFRWALAELPKVANNRLFKKKKSLPDALDISGYLDERGMPISETIMQQLRHLTASSWNPLPLDTYGAVVRVQFSGEEILPGYELANGWAGLFTRGLKIIQAKGDHLSMVRGENLVALGQQINAFLDQNEIVCNRDGHESREKLTAAVPAS